MSIAEKLTTIAENQERVYDRGYYIGWYYGNDDGYVEGYNRGYDHAIYDICPMFEERGNAVMCFPMDEMKVEAFLDEGASATVTRCGKNLFNLADCNQKFLSYNEATGMWTSLSSTKGGATGYYYGFLGKTTAQSASVAEKNLQYLIKVIPQTTVTLSVYDLSFTNPSDGSVKEPNSGTDLLMLTWFDETGAYISYNAMKITHITNGYGFISYVAPRRAKYLDIRKYYREYDMHFRSIQVEIGSKATEHEPYQCETFAITDGETIHIPALDGVNCLTIDNDGIIEVSGFSNAKALLDYVTNEIITLGADI